MMPSESKPHIRIHPRAVGLGPDPADESICLLIEGQDAHYDVALTPKQAGELLSQLRFTLNSIDGGEYSWEGFCNPVFELDDKLDFIGGEK
jgi:hypothetical protein